MLFMRWIARVSRVSRGEDPGKVLGREALPEAHSQDVCNGQ
jgi:hypothetical protein